MELREWDHWQLPSHASQGFWLGSDLAAPRDGSFTRSGCRKALLFDGGNDATTNLLTSKSIPPDSSLFFSFYLDRFRSLIIPSYSITSGRARQLCRHDEVDKGCCFSAGGEGKPSIGPRAKISTLPRASSLNPRLPSHRNPYNSPLRIHSLPYSIQRHPPAVCFHSRQRYFPVMDDWAPLVFPYRLRPPIYHVPTSAPSTLSLGTRLAACCAAAWPTLSLPRVGA
jgi:hypothetical protein